MVSSGSPFEFLRPWKSLLSTNDKLPFDALCSGRGGDAFVKILGWAIESAGVVDFFVRRNNDSSNDNDSDNLLTGIPASPPPSVDKTISFFAFAILRHLTSITNNSSNNCPPESTLRVLLPLITRLTTYAVTLNTPDTITYALTPPTEKPPLTTYTPYSTPTLPHTGYVLSSHLSALSPLSTQTLSVLTDSVINGAAAADAKGYVAFGAGEATECVRAGCDAILAVASVTGQRMQLRGNNKNSNGNTTNSISMTTFKTLGRYRLLPVCLGKLSTDPASPPLLRRFFGEFLRRLTSSLSGSPGGERALKESAK